MKAISTLEPLLVYGLSRFRSYIFSFFLLASDAAQEEGRRHNLGRHIRTVVYYSTQFFSGLLLFKLTQQQKPDIATQEETSAFEGLPRALGQRRQLPVIPGAT